MVGQWHHAAQLIFEGFIIVTGFDMSDKCRTEHGLIGAHVLHNDFVALKYGIGLCHWNGASRAINMHGIGSGCDTVIRKMNAIGV